MLCFEIFVVFALFSGNTAVTFDCEVGGKDDQEIEISETAPEGSVLVDVRETYSSLLWTVSINGTADGVMTSFLTSRKTGNHSYALELLKPLDLELLNMQGVITPDVMDEIEISVMCRSSSGRQKDKSFHLTIKPVNEFHPVFVKAPYKESVSETVHNLPYKWYKSILKTPAPNYRVVLAKQNTPVGTEIISVRDRTMDMDFGTTILTFGIAPYTISEFDGRDYVAMDDPLSGRIRLSRPLDFEAFLRRGRNYFFINVTVTDDGGLTSVTSINVTVLDYNDQGVDFVHPFCQRPCLNPNYTVITNESYTGRLDVKPVPVQARDLDTLNAPISYALASDDDQMYFRIDETSGELYQIQPLLNDSYDYLINLEVVAMEMDYDAHFAKANVSIYILERMPPTDIAILMLKGKNVIMTSDRKRGSGPLVKVYTEIVEKHIEMIREFIWPK